MNERMNRKGKVPPPFICLLESVAEFLLLQNFCCFTLSVEAKVANSIATPFPIYLRLIDSHLERCLERGQKAKATR